MRDDEMMDQLLKDALGTKAPALSPGFDDRVMRRARPRRLTSLGRAVMAAYVAIGVVTTVWLMRDLPVTWVVAAVVIGATVAAAAGAYGRRLVTG